MDRKEYSLMKFSDQLKNARLYRGYKTQAKLCIAIGVSRQVWSLWELDRRKPTMSQLVKIANLLNLEMGFFFLPGAPPEEHDLTGQGHRNKRLGTVSAREIYQQRIMPFTPTSVSGALYGFLDKCLLKKGLYAVNVVKDSGIKKALREYILLSPPEIYFKDERSISDVDFLSDEEREGIIVIYNADRLPYHILTGIVDKIYREVEGSIIFTGMNMTKTLKQYKLLYKLTDTRNLDCLNVADFENIIRKALPLADENELKIVKVASALQLKKLAEILEKLDRAGLPEPGDKIDSKKLYELMNK